MAEKRINMNQPIYQQPDPKTIETLKAARNQVIQTDKSENEDKNVNRGQNSNPGEAQFGAHNKFAEEFVQKAISLKQKKAAVDEEMTKLEARRNELTKVEDKLKELDKEMSDVLKSQ